MEDLPERVLVDPLRHDGRGPDGHEAEFPEVGEDDADDTEREIDVGRDIGDGGRRAGEPQHADVLGGERSRGRRSARVAMTVATRSKDSPACRVRPWVSA